MFSIFSHVNNFFFILTKNYCEQDFCRKKWIRTLCIYISAIVSLLNSHLHREERKGTSENIMFVILYFTLFLLSRQPTTKLASRRGDGGGSSSM